MKRFRLPVVVAGTLVVLVLLAVALAFNSTFQTWIARRAIASRPGMQVTVSSVSAGMKRVELKDVRYVFAGAVLIVPRVEIDVPLVAVAWDDDVTITRLVATGWTLDLSKTAGAAPILPTAPANGRTESSAAGSAPAPVVAPAAATEAFAGVFAPLKIPVDLSVDGVRLEGEVILPDSRGRVKVTLTGGGLAAGREGKFDLTADAALTQAGVKAIQVRGALLAAMDTPRTLTRLAAKLDAAATGEKFPDGVKLSADVTAARSDSGETYSGSVSTAGQEVIVLRGGLDRNVQTCSGTWKLDVRDSDLAPFALGLPLPAFAAKGEGAFDADTRFEAVHANGRLKTTLGRLEEMIPALSGVGELKVETEFDLAERDGTFVVQHLEAKVDAAQPVATVRVLQPFQFKPGTGELRAADAARELVALTLHAVPAVWAAPLLKPLQVESGILKGDFTATAHAGGMALRSTSPITIAGVSLAQAGKSLVRNVDIALNATADYAPKGWQAEVSGLKITSGEETLLSLDAKTGKLTGKDQALKATGTMNTALRPLLEQPAAAGTVRLTSGNARIDFVVSLDAKHEIEAKLALENLATIAETKPVKLPAIFTQLRADISPEGTITFNAPLRLEREERKSDLTIAGSIGPEKDKQRAIEANVTSNQLIIEDAQILAALLPDKTEKAVAPTPPRETAPPWAGLHGSLALQLKRIIYSDSVQVSNVTGRLRIDAGTLKLEALQAGLGDTGRADLNGALTFNATAPQPYALAAEVAVREFDPAPWFRAATGRETATVEGKFDIVSKLASRGATFADLTSGAGGQFQLTSKGGVFRGLPVDVGNIVENTSKLAALIASAGTAITAIAGKKDSADVANKAEAVAELARGLNPIPYDQLSVSVSRDAALNTTLRNFTLISPELRLTGNGTALHKPGSCLLQDSLAMEFTLRARGRQGDLLKYLGALEAQTDDLGYATCTVPVRVAGTLGEPDTNELNSKLTALAIEKSGFGDKAAEFLAKLRGGSK